MAAGSARFAMAGLEMMTPRAPLCVRTCLLSSVVLVEKAGTVTAPTDMMARSEISHSGRFSAISATRSPGLTPSAIRPRASARTSAATRAQRIEAKASPSLRHRNGFALSLFAWSKNSRGRFGIES
jgi:hypothetical protein